MSKLDELAEAIVFAHDSDQAMLALETAEARDLERAAALAASAFCGAAEAPAKLVSTLAADALAFCAERRSPPQDEPPGFTTPRPGSNGAVLTFLLGAAAAGLLVWFATPPSSQVSEAEIRARVLAELQETPMEELRRTTLAAGLGLQKQWQAGPSELRGDVRGDVVWRQEEQDGWLTFRGLPALPEDQAYQLWIVDSEREGAPVDGGVFTIAQADQETMVPIRTKLPVGKPAAFVVTVEDKGGVVVSKQEHVVAIASL